jgi:hypothetical protein
LPVPWQLEQLKSGWPQHRQYNNNNNNIIIIIILFASGQYINNLTSLNVGTQCDIEV